MRPGKHWNHCVVHSWILSLPLECNRSPMAFTNFQCRSHSLNLPSLKTTRVEESSTMMQQEGFYVQSTMTGMMKHKCFTWALFRSSLFQWCSHRKNIHDLHPQFLVTAQSWPLFVYADGQFNPNDPSKGLSKGKLLVWVSCSHESMHWLILYTSGLQSNFYFPGLHRKLRKCDPGAHLFQETS